MRSVSGRQPGFPGMRALYKEVMGKTVGGFIARQAFYPIKKRVKIDQGRDIGKGIVLRKLT